MIKFKYTTYRKIPKICPRAYIFQRPCLRGLFWRGLYSKGDLRFKIDWASLIVGSKFTVFALYYFVFEGNFPGKSPGGAYIWRGLFLEFYGMWVDRLQVNPGRFPFTPKFRKVRLENKREGQMERAISVRSDGNIFDEFEGGLL